MGTENTEDQFPADTAPVSLTGIRFTEAQRAEIRQRAGIEAEVDLQKAQIINERNTLAIVNNEDVADEVIAPEDEEILYSHRRHWIEIIFTIGILAISIFGTLLLVAVWIWLSFNPDILQIEVAPTGTQPQASNDTSDPFTQLFDDLFANLGTAFIGLINAVIQALASLVITLEPYFPILIPALLIGGIVYACLKGAKDILLWYFTKLVVTENYFIFITKLPEHKWWQWVLTALKVNPNNDPLPRNIIDNPQFGRTFLGVLFGFGWAQLETRVQRDDNFANIQNIAHFKKFERLMDPTITKAA